MGHAIGTPKPRHDSRTRRRSRYAPLGPVMSPFANILHRDAIQRLADAGTYQRGQRYFSEKRVNGLVRRESTLAAVVRGSSSYRVRIWVKDAGLAYSCTCPMGEDGAFCKHTVAVGLAWLAQEDETSSSDETAAPTSTLDEPLRAELEATEHTVLVDVLLEALTYFPGLRERIEQKLIGRR